MRKVIIAQTVLSKAVEIYVKDFLESKGVASIEFCLTEDILKEIEDVKIALSNERFWEKGYAGDVPNPHTKNIETLEEYLNFLENSLPKEVQYNWNDRIYQGEAYGSEITIGDMQISCVRNARLYKDGTRQYLVYLKVWVADSKKVIALTKICGHLDDAKREAEKFLDKIKEDLCKN